MAVNTCSAIAIYVIDLVQSNSCSNYRDHNSQRMWARGARGPASETRTEAAIHFVGESSSLARRKNHKLLVFRWCTVSKAQRI
jgi:hypothetical protein